MSKYAVEVKNIKKSFFLPHHKNNSLKSAITQAFKPKEKGGKTFNALNGISFNVEKGDFFGILGRNGSGKSTLLKIISEIYQPTAGSVKHDGKVVSFIELGVGFKAELSGRENIYLNGALLGFSKQEVDDMYDEIVGFAELEKFMDQKLKNYSSGMKVRLAFSVAIRAKADILILDEVLAVGDAAFQKKCYDYFRTLKQDGKTVILVTHGMGAVRDFCSKAIVIEGGKIIFEGSAHEAADAYNNLFDESKKSEEEILEKEEITESQKEAKISKVHVNASKKWIDIKVGIDSSAHIEAGMMIGVNFVRDDSIIGGFDTDLIEGGVFPEMLPGDSYTMNIKLKNILGTGLYKLVVGAKTKNNKKFYDVVMDAAVIQNYNSANPDGYFPVVFPATLNVDKASLHEERKD